MLSRKRKAWT